MDVSHLALPVCVCARGEVSSSNKRKVALWILLLLHTDHLPPSPLLGYRSSSSFSSTTASSSSTAASSLPLFLATAPISRSTPCKQSDSKLPAVVTHSATMTTEPRRGFEHRGRERRGGSGLSRGGGRVCLIRFEGLWKWRCQTRRFDRIAGSEERFRGGMGTIKGESHRCSFREITVKVEKTRDEKFGNLSGTLTIGINRGEQNERKRERDSRWSKGG